MFRERNSEFDVKFDKWNYVQSIEWNWHLFPALLKGRASILKDPDGEDGVTDKEGTKRHARWALAVFSVARSTPKSAELRWVETADEPCTWPQFVLSIYTSWNVPATFARQTARCSISNTLRKRGERDPACLPYNYHLHRENIYVYTYKIESVADRFFLIKTGSNLQTRGEAVLDDITSCYTRLFFDSIFLLFERE